MRNTIKDQLSATCACFVRAGRQDRQAGYKQVLFCKFQLSFSATTRQVYILVILFAWVRSTWVQLWVTQARLRTSRCATAMAPAPCMMSGLTT
jgi:hypothetical protein